METATLNKVVEVSTTTTELKRALRIISKVIKIGQIVPIVEYVYFHVEFGVLTVTGGDLGVRISRKIFIRNDFVKADFLIPFPQLWQLLAVIPAGEITVIYSEDIQKVTIKAEDSVFTIHSTYSYLEYPAAPKCKFTKAFNLEGADVEEGLTISQRSTSNDDLRPAMTGVFFDSSENYLQMVATDGHVLSVYETKTEILDPAESFIVSTDTIKAVLATPHLLKYGVLVYYAENYVKFEIAETEIVARRITERYPDWKSAISKDPQYTIHLNIETLVKKLAIAAVFSNQTTNEIEFLFKGRKVELKTEDMDYLSESSQYLELGGEETEELNHFRIGFNGKFMRKQFKPFFGLTRAEFWAANRHALFYPQTKNARSFKILIMPVMLNSYY